MNVKPIGIVVLLRQTLKKLTWICLDSCYQISYLGGKKDDTLNNFNSE